MPRGCLPGCRGRGAGRSKTSQQMQERQLNTSRFRGRGDVKERSAKYVAAAIPMRVVLWVGRPGKDFGGLRTHSFDLASSAASCSPSAPANNVAASSRSWAHVPSKGGVRSRVQATDGYGAHNNLLRTTGLCF